MTLFVVDVSDFNGTVNPFSLRQSGILGLTSKVGEGGQSHFVHSSFTGNITSAKNAGMILYGGYYVVRTNTGVSVWGQVLDFLRLLDQRLPWWRTDPRFVLQIDLERWSYDNVPVSVGIEFGRYLRQQAPGHAIFLYASEGQYPGTRTTEFFQWNAAYHDDRYDSAYTLYQSYGGDGSNDWHSGAYTFWQYTEHGQLPGYTGDVSAYRGTEQQLLTLIGAAPVQAPVLEPDVL